MGFTGAHDVVSVGNWEWSCSQTACFLHLIMHRTIGLTGYVGPLNVLVCSSVSPTIFCFTVCSMLMIQTVYMNSLFDTPQVERLTSLAYLWPNKLSSTKTYCPLLDRATYRRLYITGLYLSLWSVLPLANPGSFPATEQEIRWAVTNLLYTPRALFSRLFLQICRFTLSLS